MLLWQCTSPPPENAAAKTSAARTLGANSIGEEHYWLTLPLDTGEQMLMAFDAPFSLRRHKRTSDITQDEWYHNRIDVHSPDSARFLIETTLWPERDMSDHDYRGFFSPYFVNRFGYGSSLDFDNALNYLTRQFIQNPKKRSVFKIETLYSFLIKREVIMRVYFIQYENQWMFEAFGWVGHHAVTVHGINLKSREQGMEALSTLQLARTVDTLAPNAGWLTSEGPFCEGLK